MDNADDDNLSLGFTIPHAPDGGKPKKDKGRKRRGWWKKMALRLKSEAKISYRPYDPDLSTRSNTYTQPDGILDSVSVDEELQTAKWKVKERPPQDASLIPTLGMMLALGPQGLVTFILLYSIVFASNAQRALLVALIIIGMAQPRDNSKRSCSDLALILSLYVIIAAAVYLKSIPVLTLAISLALPLNVFGKVGYKIGEWIASQSEKYFALKTTVEDEAALVEISQRGDPIIFAQEPHDFMSLGCVAFHPKLEVLPPGRVRDTMKCLVSSAVLNTPIFRHIQWWCRCESVEKSNFKTRLMRKESLVFVPGGVHEVFLMNPSEPQDLVLNLKNRKGFIKLALENGTPVVPSFTFGLDGSYACHIPTGDMINKLSRRIGFLPVVFWGRWYIPFGIPRPQKLHVVIGKPISLPCLGDAITGEDVEKYHGIFLKELEDLFERHKVAEELYCDRTLKIM